MLDHRRNLDRINTNDARAAYCALVEGTVTRGVAMENNTGAVAAVKCLVEGEYAFSFCSYGEYISFYLRPPALRRWPDIHDEALSHFSQVEQNPAGETVIKLADQREADRLTSWLYSKF